MFCWYCALDVAGRDDELCLHRVGIDQQIAKPALLGHPVLLLVLVEAGAHLRVRDGDVLLHGVGGEDDHLQLHLFVSLTVLALEIGLRDRHPVGHRGAQLLHEQGAPEVLLEFLGGERGALHAQYLLVRLLAGELPVLLEGWDEVDALGHFRIAHGKPQPAGFRDRGALVDELLQNLLLDPHLFEQLLVDAAAVRTLVGLQLGQVGSTECCGRDLLVPDTRHDGTRCRRVLGVQEVWDVEKDEREHHEREAPLEPATVPAHPVEHCHC